MSEDLMPIGTEYWQAYPVIANACDPGKGMGQTRFLYRVVAHDDCAKSLDPQAPTFKMCRLDTIASQFRSVIGMRPVKLSDRYIYDYIFGAWEAEEWRDGETPHEVVQGKED